MLYMYNTSRSRIIYSHTVTEYLVYVHISVAQMYKCKVSKGEGGLISVNYFLSPPPPPTHTYTHVFPLLVGGSPVTIWLTLIPLPEAPSLGPEVSPLQREVSPQVLLSLSPQHREMTLSPRCCTVSL